MPCMALHGRFGCVDPCFEAGVRGRMWLPGDWMTLCSALGLQILRFAQNADYPHTVDLVGINAAEVFRKQKIQPLWLDFSASGIRDSNSRPSAWEADALPTELIPQSSDPHRIQTCNLLIRSQMLYSVELGDQSFYSASASFLATLNLRSLILAFLPDRLRR